MARIVPVAKFTSDSSEVRRDFDKMGDAGERMADRVKRGAQQLSPALRAIDASAGVAREKMESAAGSAGSLGTVLRSMGPVGLAVAAGIGAAVVAITALHNGARDAVRDLGQLNMQAERLGVSTNALQEWRFAVLGTGQAAEQADAAIGSFAEKLGEATLRASGGGFDSLRMLGFTPEDISNMHDIEATLPRIAERLANVADATQQVRIARELGLEPLLPLLQQGAQAFDRAAETAHRLGYVLDEELLQRSAQLNGEWQQASAVIDLQLKAALIDLAPVFVDLAGVIGDAARGLRDFLDAFKEVEDRSTEGVRNATRNAYNTVTAYRRLYDLEADETGRLRTDQLQPTIRRSVDRAQDRLFELQAELDRRAATERRITTPRLAPGTGTTSITPPGSAPTDAELARLRSFVDQLDAQADAAARLADVQSRFPKAAQDELAARTQLEEQMEQLNAARERGVIGTDAELEVMRQRLQASFDAAQGEREHAAALAARAQIESQVASYRSSVASPEERLRQQLEDLNKLREASRTLPSGGITDEEYERGLRGIREEYEKIAEAQYRASLQGQIFNGIIDGQIRSFDDLLRVFVDLGANAFLEELRSGGLAGGDIGGFLGGVGDRIAVGITGDEGATFGGLFGGGNDAASRALEELTAGAAGAGKELLEGLAPSVAEGVVKLGISATATGAETVAKNTGTASLVIMTKAANTAAAALAQMAAAAKGDEIASIVTSAFGGKGGGKAFGGPLSLGMRHAVTEGNQSEILLLNGSADVLPHDSVEGLKAMLSFARDAARTPAHGGGGGAVNVTLRNESGVEMEADAQAAAGPDGSLEVMVMLRRQVSTEMAGGSFDREMRGRYGATPKRIRR